MPNFNRRHPETSYNTKYPYNRVTITESGHELHWDDTAGNERIRFAHMSGSYFELSPDGRKVEMTVNHNVTYAKGGITVTTDKNYDYKAHGSNRESIGGHRHEEVAGDYTSTMGMNHQVVTGIDYTELTGGDTTKGTVGNYLEHVGGSYRRKHDAGAQVFTTGDSHHNTSGTHLIEAALIILKAGTIILESGDIRLGGEGADRELGLRGSFNNDTEFNGPDELTGNLSTAVKAI